jgi:hypothetical protein
MGRELARATLGVPVRDLMFPASPLTVPAYFRFPAALQASVRALIVIYRVRDAMELARYGRGSKSAGVSTA